MTIRAPKFKMWDFRKRGNRVLAGIYEGCVPNLGKFHSTIYFIRVGKVRWAIWGTLGIKRNLQWLEFGRKVRIEFKGVAKGKKGKRVYNYRITSPAPRKKKLEA